MTDDNKTTTGTGGSADPANSTAYDIPTAVLEQHKDLVDLIKQTKSMNDKERQYWFHILPAMNEKQVEKLRAILINEKDKLAQIDDKYGKKLKDIQQQRSAEWESGQYKEKLSLIRNQEDSAEADEQAQEEALLKELDNL